MVEADVASISDVVMSSLLAMLSTSSGQVGGVQEDALLTIGALVESISYQCHHDVFICITFLALGNGCFKYIGPLQPYLLRSLETYSDVQVS